MFSLGWVNFQSSAACCKPKIPSFHPQCLLHTYFGHSVPTFGREFLASIPALPCKLLLPIPGLWGKFLALALSLLLCMAHFSRPVLVGLANFFLLHLFFCPPMIVDKIDQRQTYHKKHKLCQVLHKSSKCLRGKNIEDGWEQIVHCNRGQMTRCQSELYEFSCGYMSGNKINYMQSRLTGLRDVL